MTDRKLVIDRRATLMWLSASMAAACTPGEDRAHPKKAQPALPGEPLDPAQAAAANVRSAEGYGKDPDLFSAESPWQRIMTDRQKLLSAALADIILPATDDFPTPSEIGIEEFVDEWVSAPYPEQVADGAAILPGLAMIDDAAKLHGADGFAEASTDIQIEIVSRFAAKEGDAAQARRRAFFETFRKLVLGAYYTTQTGYDEIGYIGNVAMFEFPGPSPEIKSVLETELSKRGL